MYIAWHTTKKKVVYMNKKLDKGDIYRIYVFDEMARKENHKKHGKCSLKDLADYVDHLSDSKAKRLCRHLSHSRKNGVYRFISKGPDSWVVREVGMSDILVRSINSNVNGHLSRNKWSLKNISKDKKIPRLREFKKEGKIHKRSISLLAHKRGHKFKLIDGNHRAIKMACNGKKEFRLIIPNK